MSSAIDCSEFSEFVVAITVASDISEYFESLDWPQKFSVLTKNQGSQEIAYQNQCLWNFE